MNNKDFFKHLLENEMPDLEDVRKKCIATDTKKNSGIIKLSKRDFVLKRILPIAACIAIAVVSIAAFYTKDTPENFISPPSQFNGEDFSGKLPSEKTTDKSKHNNYSNHTNPTESQTTQATTAESTTEWTTIETIPVNPLFQKPKVSKNYVSFDSFNGLYDFVSTLILEDGEVISNGENGFVLKIPSDEISMLLVDKKVYSFSIKGQSLCNTVILEKNVADGLTGCSFSANYDGNEYELGYSTYKCSKSISAENEFVTSQGYSVKMVGDNYFSLNIDGYHFYVKSFSNDIDASKDFIDNLVIYYNSIS